MVADMWLKLANVGVPTVSYHGFTSVVPFHPTKMEVDFSRRGNSSLSKWHLRDRF